jgi:hypothetical protein
MNRIFIFPLTLGLHSGLCAASPPGDSYEQTLLDTIREIQSLDHDQALDSTRDLIKQYPHSRLGHMLYADLLLAKAEPLTEIGSGIEVDRAIQDFRYEIQQRWQHDSSQAHQDLYPESILFLAEDQPYVILVDQQSSRVYVYRNNAGDLQLETDYFITIGLKGYGKQKRGDQKTPIGVYHVTRYIDGMELPDLYGEGAFPIKYPNTWDLRKQRTGAGIWIHGTPSYTSVTTSRAKSAVYPTISRRRSFSRTAKPASAGQGLRSMPHCATRTKRNSQSEERGRPCPLSGTFA